MFKKKGFCFTSGIHLQAQSFATAVIFTSLLIVLLIVLIIANYKLLIGSCVTFLLFVATDLASYPTTMWCILKPIKVKTGIVNRYQNICCLRLCLFSFCGCKNDAFCSTLLEQPGPTGKLK